MDCFKILEISPTKDIKAIKKAYSSLLQKYSPETDPSGFQTLREAYEEAISKAQAEDDIEKKPISSVDEFMKSFEEHYNNFEKRISISCWKELLESDICYNIDTGKEVSNRILRFIMDNYNFPYDVWVLFNSYFSWTTKKDKLYTQFPKNFIDYIAFKVNNNGYFRYTHLINCKDRKQDYFITEYNTASSALDDYDLYQAKKSIDLAKEVCPAHPDLMIITARYLMINGQLEEANTMLSAMIENDTSDLYAYFYRGNLFSRIGKYLDAYHDYKKAAAMKPDFVDVLFSLGKCCISLGKYEEAIEFLNKLRELLKYNREVQVLLNSAYLFRIDSLKDLLAANPDDMDLKYKTAEAYYSASKPEDSYTILCELEQNTEINHDVYLLLCKVLISLEKKELAYSTVCKALEIYPLNYKLIVFKACILDEFEKYQDAIDTYDRAISINPDDPLTHNNKAFALNKMNRFNEALESSNKSISLNPDMAHAYKNKAEALLGLELYEESFEACEQALNIYPYLVDVFIIKMKLLTRVGQYEEALSIFSKAVDYELKDSRLYSEKANILRLYKNYDESINLCDQALELDEKNKNAHYLKGLCHYNKENYAEAISCFDKAIGCDPYYDSPYFFKILSLLNDSKRDAALHELEKAISLNFRSIDRFYELKGDILSNQEKYSEAIIAYKKAVDKNPVCASYYYSIGSSFNNLSRFKESLEYIDKAIELDPSMVNAYIEKSHALYNLGKYKECIDQCSQALEIDPNFLLAHQNKAWALYKIGNIKEAEEFCSNGLKIDGNHVNLLYLKIRILKDKGLIKEALIVTDRILEINPQDEYTVKIRQELTKMDKPKRKFFDLFSK